MSDRPPELDRLVADYQRRLRAGEAPSPDDYAARHPELADRIRDVFPVVAALERALPCPHPARLGDYRIVREVGRGGMGVVYEAVQESLNRRVAVKVFPPSHADRPGLLERFARESQAAGRLHHTNIVPVFGVGTDAGLSYFAMQFIPGGGLDRVIAAVRASRGPADRTPAGAADPTAPGLAPGDATPLPPAVLVGQTGAAYFRTAARLGFEAADALAHAHAHGVQHRDIKPSNLLVDDAGTLWVTDFGLAKLDDASDLTATGDHLGTLRYAPPERFRGTADERADIYSLGATFYELLTLRAAFPEPAPHALIEQIRTTDPPAPRALDPAVPRDLDTICRKCLAKDPARRYPSAALLAADLRAFLDGRPITARRVGPVEAAGKWVRRRPVAATVLAAAAVMAAGTAGLLAEREWAGQATRSEALVRTLLSADTDELPPVLADLDGYRSRASPALAELASRPVAQRAGLHGRLALLADHPRYAAEVCDYLLDCPAGQLVPVRQTAGPHLSPHRERFWAVLLDPREAPAARVRAAGVLAGQTPGDPRWAAVADPLAGLLVSIDPVELGHLTRAVAPVLPKLVTALQARYERDRRELAGGFAPPAELAARVGRMNAAAVLLWQTLGERPEAVVWLAGVADDAHLSAALAAVRNRWPEFGPRLRAELANAGDDPESARRTAGFAAAVLANAGPDDPAWGLFRAAPDPTVRSHLIRRAAPAGVPAGKLAERFAVEADASARAALLLALAEHPAADLPAGFLPKLLDLYAAHPDAGLHAAAGWALRHCWGQAAAADRLDRWLRVLKPAGGRGWFVAPHGGTFAVVPAPGRVRIGTPDEPRLSDEVPAEVDLPRAYAVGCTEVTAELFGRWPGRPRDADGRPEESGAGEQAVGGVSWYAAAAFCNWLSGQEGVPPDQWCYEPNAAGQYAAGMRPAPDHLGRTGYRLPTEAEWEYAARGGCGGPRFFGRADGLLTRYAWAVANAGDAAHPVGRLRPNDRGLFDVLGNVHEWADDPYSEVYPPGPRPDLGLVGPVREVNHVLRGGAYNLPESRLRAAFRYNIIPSNNPSSCGFRLARTVPAAGR